MTPLSLYVSESLDREFCDKLLNESKIRLNNALILSLNDVEREILESVGIESLLEGSIADKMKSMYDKISTQMKEKGAQSLSAAQQKILKFRGNIETVVTYMISKIREYLKLGLTEYTKAAKSAVNGGKKEIEAALKKVDMGDLTTEVENFKKMSKHAMQWVLNGFPNSAATAAKKGVRVNESYVIQSLLEASIHDSITTMLQDDPSSIKLFEFDQSDLMESDSHEGAEIPYLSSVAKSISKYPPFNVLHDIQHLITDKSKAGLTALSKALTKTAHAPGPFEFAVLSYLIGTIGEYTVKSIAASGLAWMLGFVPGINIALLIIKKVALGLSIVGMVEVIMAASKRHKESGEHKDDEDTSKDENKNGKSKTNNDE